MLNMLGLEQNCHHFAKDTSKYIYLNKNIWFSDEILMKYTPWGFIQESAIIGPDKAWGCTGLVYWCIYTSFSIDEVTGQNPWVFKIYMINSPVSQLFFS